MWLKNHVERVIKPLFNQNRTQYYKILLHWHVIVGNDLKHMISPQDIRFSKNKINILIVKIDNYCNILKIQMMTPNIIDKITRYFGYQVISKIKIIGLNHSSPKDSTTTELEKPALTNPLSKKNDVILSINKNYNNEIKEILVNIAQHLQ